MNDHGMLTKEERAQIRRAVQGVLARADKPEDMGNGWSRGKRGFCFTGPAAPAQDDLPPARQDRWRGDFPAALMP